MCALSILLIHSLSLSLSLSHTKHSLSLSHTQHTLSLSLSLWVILRGRVTWKVTKKILSVTCKRKKYDTRWKSQPLLFPVMRRLEMILNEIKCLDLFLSLSPISIYFYYFCCCRCYRFLFGCISMFFEKMAILGQFFFIFNFLSNFTMTIFKWKKCACCVRVQWPSPRHKLTTRSSESSAIPLGHTGAPSLFGYDEGKWRDKSFQLQDTLMHST